MASQKVDQSAVVGGRSLTESGWVEHRAAYEPSVAANPQDCSHLTVVASKIIIGLDYNQPSEDTAILSHLRSGDVHAAVAWYAVNGRITVSP